MSRAKAIQQLLAKNYNVYIPISTSKTLVLELNNELKKCLIRTVAIPKEGSPIVSIAQRTGNDQRLVDEQSTNYILCVAVDKLWLIPISDVASFISIRLGKKWEHCILEEVEDVGKMMLVKDSDKELRKAAREAAERL